MPKLPADLPENWTQGQTISPNGTEVGLTEKHGYNYLMKQVNNTQTEVNGINTALTDVAQQATVDEINNKIGTEADADTQPTLFGRLAQLKNMLLENLAKLLTKVTGIDGKIGTSEDSAGTDTLFGKIQKIIGATSAPRYVYSNTVQATPDGYSGSGVNRTTAVLYNMVAEYDGIIGFEASFYIKGNNASHRLTPVAISTSMPKGRLNEQAAGFEDLYDKPAGTIYTSSNAFSADFPIFLPNDEASYQNISMYQFTDSSSGTNKTARLDVECKKGDHVLFLVCLNANTTQNNAAEFNISNIKVLYDVV